jgi:glutathione S-transferase
MKAKWAKVSSRFEAILIRNGGTYMVGQAMTYADVLVAHSLTWFVEEVRLVYYYSILMETYSTVIESHLIQH